LARVAVRLRALFRASELIKLEKPPQKPCKTPAKT